MTAKGKIKTTLIILGFAAVVIAVASVCVKTAFKTLYPLKYTDVISDCAEEYGLEKEILFAMINCESSFKADAVSGAGAMGLTQITPETFKWLQSKTGEKLEDEALLDAETSVKYGAFFIRMLLDEFENVETAFAAYHSGRGKVNEWLSNSEYSKDGKTLDVIPAKNTKIYVERIVNAINVYNKLYE